MPEPNYIRIDPMPMIPFPSSPPFSPTVPGLSWEQPVTWKYNGTVYPGQPVTITFDTLSIDTNSTAAIPPITYTYNEV